MLLAVVVGMGRAAQALRGCWPVACSAGWVAGHTQVRAQVWIKAVLQWRGHSARGEGRWTGLEAALLMEVETLFTYCNNENKERVEGSDNAKGRQPQSRGRLATVI